MAEGTAETNDMVKIVREALDSISVQYTVVPEERCRPNIPMISFGMTGSSSTYHVLLSMDLEDDIFGVYFTSPTKVVEEHRPAIAEYFMRINYHVMLGHFDLDARDGEFRFKLSCVLTASALSIEMVLHMIHVASTTMERFFPGVMAVQFGNKTPQEAFNDINSPALAGSIATTPPPATTAQ